MDFDPAKGSEGIERNAKCSVLLLAHGGPRSLDEVAEFAQRLLGPDRAGPEAIRRLEERYRAIGGGSPLAEETGRQAERLREYLEGPALGDLEETFGGAVDVRVFVGTRFGHPRLEEAVRDAYEFADGAVAAVILSAQPPEAVVAKYVEEVQAALGEQGESTHVAFVPSWGRSPGYLDALAGKVRSVLADDAPGDPRTEDDDLVLLFTAHSLPVRPGYGDRAYETSLFETARKVVERVGERRWLVAYQSAPSGAAGEWLGPAAEEVLETLAAEGVRRVLVIPLVFVSEHLETLYDLDVRVKESAETLGIEMRRVPTVGTDPRFIGALGMAVVDTLRPKREER